MIYTATLLTSSLGANPTLDLPHDEHGRPHAFLRTTVDRATGVVRIWERVARVEDASASYAVLGETGPGFPNVLRQSLATIAESAHPIDVGLGLEAARPGGRRCSRSGDSRWRVRPRNSRSCGLVHDLLRALA